MTGHGHAVCRELGQACDALLHDGHAENEARSRQPTRSERQRAHEAGELLAGDTFWY